MILTDDKKLSKTTHKIITWSPKSCEYIPFGLKCLTTGDEANIITVRVSSNPQAKYFRLLVSECLILLTNK